MRRFVRFWAWVQRIVSTVLFGWLLIWCIVSGYIAGAILSGLGFAVTLYVLYARAVYFPALLRTAAAAKAEPPPVDMREHQ